MSVIYSIAGLIALIIVAALTYRAEKLQGEDNEPDTLAIAKNVVIALVIEIVLWQVIKVIAGLSVDYWWYRNLGYAQVWSTNVTTQWTLRLAGLAIAYLALSAGQLIAETSVPRIPVKPEPETGRRRSYTYGDRSTNVFDNAPVLQRYYKTSSRLLKFLISLVFASWAANLTQHFLLVTHQVGWGKFDPIFGMDYSFYAVTLPFLEKVLTFATILLFTSLLYTAVVYVYLAYRDSLFENYYDDYDGVKERIMYGAIGQGLLYAFVFWLLMAASTYTSRFDTLINGSSKIITGAGFIDIVAKIPGMNFMFWTLLVSAAVMLVMAFQPRKWIFAAYNVVAVILIWLVAMAIIPWAKGLQYNTNPIGFERKYIQYQLDSTRFAYNLDKIKNTGQTYNYASQMTGAELKASDPTLSETRIVDWQPMLAANNTLNEFIPAYDFSDVDIDRYNGKEVMLSVRELNIDQIPEDAKNWVNTHFRYTNGFGFTVASVSDVDGKGEPVWLVRNIPPSGPAEFMVEHPQIYFGEETVNYVFVNGTIKEYGRPEGNNLQEVNYDGHSGFNIGGATQRFALAVALDDYRILFTSLLGPNSRVIFDRTLDQRLNRLAPFLVCDGDPYPVLGGSEVVYIRDCYTENSHVPYSQTYAGINYIRGSIKMTVGAWSGDTNFYVVDGTDPLINSWSRVYPGLFKPLTDMPTYLQAHLRYPDDLLTLQAAAYTLYHIQTPDAFFNRQDQWSRAKEIQSVGGDASAADPRYVMMTIPGNDKPEFVSNIYFTPYNKQVLVGGLTARNDPGVYGELEAFEFPRDQTVIGPQMVEARINQDSDLSPKITLWNQQGSTVLWGQIIGLVIPAHDNTLSVVYVRSLYLQSKEAQIPSIKLVIISQGDSLVYAPSLAQALEALYTGQVVPVSTDNTQAPTGTSEDLAKQALDHYNKAQSCAADGNWVCFGQEMVALRQVLEALQK